MSPRKKRAAVFLSFAAGAAVSGACRAPTQAEVVITTTAPCSEIGDVAIVASDSPSSAEGRVGDGYYAAQTNHCDTTQRIGSLVVTPGGDRAAVVVIAPPRGKPLSECKPPKYEGCIIARRAFSFIDHVSLNIPISLDVECRSVPCDAFTTCRKGACYSAEWTCETSGECHGVGELPDGGLSPDAEVPVDGSPPRDGSAGDGSSNDGSSDDGATEGGGTDGGVDGGMDGGPPPPEVSCGGGMLMCNGTLCLGPSGCCSSPMVFPPTPACFPDPTVGTCAGPAGKTNRYCCDNTNCGAAKPTCNAVNGQPGVCVL